jgi:hypothetical protein
MIKPKLKRGTSHNYNGQTVFVEIDKGSEVLVCDNELRRLEDNYFTVKKSELKPISKARTGIVSKPKKLTDQEKAKQGDINDFFDKMAESMPYNCQGCHKPLYAFTKKMKRCVTSHILPKAVFESVATEPDNILFLGTSLLGVCECHNRWDDKGAEDRAKLPFYNLALERFEKFKHLLTDKELIQAYKYLNIK